MAERGVGRPTKTFVAERGAGRPTRTLDWRKTLYGLDKEPDRSKTLYGLDKEPDRSKTLYGLDKEPDWSMCVCVYVCMCVWGINFSHLRGLEGVGGVMWILEPHFGFKSNT